MAHKTLIDGTAYTIKGGKDLIDGTAYTKKQGKTLIDGTEKTIGVGVDKSVFADNEWSEIIDACHNGTVPSTWEVGDSKMMDIGGTEYQIDIIGKDQDTYYLNDDESINGTTVPLTFQLHGVLQGEKVKFFNEQETNDGGWWESDIRAYLLSTVMQKLPQEVQSGIRKIKNRAFRGTQVGLYYIKADTLFLLSEYEVFGVNKNGLSAEGVRYQYYKKGGEKRKYEYPSQEGNTYGKPWWLRSCPKDLEVYASDVESNGNNLYNAVWEEQYIAFAFCF